MKRSRSCWSALAAELQGMHLFPGACKSLSLTTQVLKEPALGSSKPYLWQTLFGFIQLWHFFGLCVQAT